LVRQINEELIDELMQRVHQSNDDIEIYDLELTFTINPNALIVGQGAFGKPKWLTTNDYKQSWRTFEGPDGFNVSCAATAITIALAKDGKFGPGNVNLGSDERKQNNLIRYASELQNELQWNCDTSISDLSNFPTRYPEYRLVVVIPYTRNYRSTSYVSSEWTATDVKDAKKKTIYLLYDETNRHFGLVRSPATVYRDFHKSGGWCFCHKCLSIYLSSKGHEDCAWSNTIRYANGVETEIPTPAFCSRATLMAKKFGDEHYCNHCALHSQLAKSGVKGAYNLRCPLYCKSKTGIIAHQDAQGNFLPFDIEAEEEELGSENTIIIYDIESAVIRTEETYTADALIREFVDEDSIAPPEEDDGHNIIRLYKSEHTPNLLVWCNMDTPEDLHEETDIGSFVRKMLEVRIINIKLI